MGLIFGMPNVRPDMEEVLAAIQVWSGQIEGAGRLIDVPYDSSFYRSTAGTWTVQLGDQSVFRYSIMQDLMFLRVRLRQTTTSAGMGNDLRILIPAGYRCSDNGHLGHFQWNAETAALSAVGTAYASSDGRWVRLLRDTLAVSTSWPSSETNSFNVELNFTFPIIPQ